MQQSHKFAVGVFASLALGIAVATAYAHPGTGQVGGGMEQHMKSGMQHDAKGGMGHAGMGGGKGHAGQQLMTPEERTALREKMRNARTPEERGQIATATRAEVQKRARETAITLPEGQGPRAGATTEHAH